MTARNAPSLGEFLLVTLLWLWQGYRYLAWVAWPVALFLAWQSGAFK